MTFKVKKIKNIDKNICFAEQKIAYNYAFKYYMILEKAKKRTAFEFQYQEVLQDIINMIIEDCKDNGIADNYNLDVIIICFRQGIDEYLKLKYKMLTSYDEIGKIFHFPYDYK